MGQEGHRHIGYVGVLQGTGGKACHFCPPSLNIVCVFLGHLLQQGVRAFHVERHFPLIVVPDAHFIELRRAHLWTAVLAGAFCLGIEVEHELVARHRPGVLGSHLLGGIGSHCLNPLAHLPLPVVKVYVHHLVKGQVLVPSAHHGLHLQGKGVGLHRHSQEEGVGGMGVHAVTGCMEHAFQILQGCKHVRRACLLSGCVWFNLVHKLSGGDYELGINWGQIISVRFYFFYFSAKL